MRAEATAQDGVGLPWVLSLSIPPTIGDTLAVTRGSADAMGFCKVSGSAIER